MIIRAENFIRKRMKGFRMDGKTPNFMHPIDVFSVLEEMDEGTGKILKEIGMFEELGTVCLLHDALEGTEITEEELTLEFGRHVSAYVQALTKKKTDKFGTPGLVEYFYNLQTAGGVQAQIVKCLDRIANLRNLSRFTEYRRERYFFETKMFVIPIAMQVPDPWRPWLIQRLGPLSLANSELAPGEDGLV